MILSKYAHVIVLWEGGINAETMLSVLNSFAGDIFRVVPIDDFAGGKKVFCWSMAATCNNRFPIGEFCQWLRQQDLECLDGLQVWGAGGEDTAFQSERIVE